MTVISSSIPFPNVSWWMHVSQAEKVMLDIAEHFQKMSFRNRYRIAGANNTVLLSIPLLHGRNQRIPMSEVKIYNDARWQQQHWRTIASAYNRSPYFMFYESGLKVLFETQFESLASFNVASIAWVRKQLKMTFEIVETTEYQKNYHKDYTDLRSEILSPRPLPIYHQVFEDRLGFTPDLSILDLLFAEGPMAVNKLRNAQF